MLPPYSFRRAALPLVVVLAAAGLVTSGCGSADRTMGLVADSDAFRLSSDTLTGAATLAELQAWKARWEAQGLHNYKFNASMSCFCAADYTRPVVIDVRDGQVFEARFLADNRLVPRPSNGPYYFTISDLYDRAIAERERNGYVSVVYDRGKAYPARLVIGTLASDGGVSYAIGNLNTP